MVKKGVQASLYGFLCTLFLSCTAFPTSAGPPADAVGTVVSGTLAAYTASASGPGTFTPIATFTLTSEPTLEPFSTYYVYTRAENVNLRTNPGELFTVSRVMRQGTRLQVLGRSPGGDWLNVMSDESINGWVKVAFVEGGRDGPPPPVIKPQDIQLVSGSVLDESGKLVSGISFAIVQGNGSNQKRTDATTDETGWFYAYLPKHLNGVWTVDYVSIACTSNVMDTNCDCIGGVCGAPNPESVNVTLPTDVPLSFVWN
jgi:SH3-like domain-containing protein